MNKANGPVEPDHDCAGDRGCWRGLGGMRAVSWEMEDDYGDEVVVTGPDLFLFGGGYDRGRDEHDYSRRGSESRAGGAP